ncbi:MAG TPA: GAF domain-containing protein [Desulfobacteraceae bacterium]|nr:GAF domain-containing protein [Desulfobacteraceae bacterium]HPJ66584.1 GAF domain-containing protein [Desulfobacteraceae bacterium]HPQ28804.1 GAF domain-containing protein [Desulfobacteraceae bacterium]
MNIRKKLFLAYLLVIFLATVLIFLIWKFAHYIPEIHYSFHPIVLFILLIPLIIAYLISHIFSLRIKGVIDRFKEIPEAENGKISHDSGDELKILFEMAGKILSKFKQEGQKLNILFEISRLVSSLPHLQDVLDTIVEILTKEFRLDACSIRLLDDDGKLRIKSYKGLTQKFVEAATREPTVDSYSGECFLTGRIVVVNDANEIKKPISTVLLVGENINSFAVSPIKVEGETIGVLVTASRKSNYFHESFDELIYTICNQIGIAIRISRLYDDLYNFSRQLEINIQKRTAELKDKSEKLVEAEKLAAQGQMANRIAHELRNPLTVVGGFARRMYDATPDDDRDKKYLKIILEEVEVLEKKISEIIKFKPEDG